MSEKQKAAVRRTGLLNKKSPGTAAFNLLYSHYQKSAKDRNLAFTLTKEKFRELTTKNCHYCGINAIQKALKGPSKQRLNGEYLHNGLDRKDNTLGYIPDNSLPCCKVCNYAKRTLSYDEFLSYIDRLVKFRTSNVA